MEEHRSIKGDHIVVNRTKYCWKYTVYWQVFVFPVGPTWRYLLCSPVIVWSYSYKQCYSLYFIVVDIIIIMYVYVCGCGAHSQKRKRRAAGGLYVPVVVTLNNNSQIYQYNRTQITMLQRNQTQKIDIQIDILRRFPLYTYIRGFLLRGMFRLINAWVLMLHIDCLMASLIIIIIIIIIYSDDTGQRRRKAGYICQAMT